MGLININEGNCHLLRFIMLLPCTFVHRIKSPYFRHFLFLDTLPQLNYPNPSRRLQGDLWYDGKLIKMAAIECLCSTFFLLIHSFIQPPQKQSLPHSVYSAVHSLCQLIISPDHTLCSTTIISMEYEDCHLVANVNYRVQINNITK